MSDQEDSGLKMSGSKPVPEGTVLDGDAMKKLADGEPPKEVVEAFAEQDTETKTKVILCPRCGWDVVRRDKDTVTEEDKKRFVRSVLGNKRYTKDFEFLGGAMKVIFRSVKPNEMDVILKQLRADTAAGKVVGEAEYLVYYSRYMLSCSLQSISTEEEGQSFVSVDDILSTDAGAAYKEDENATILPALYADLAKKWQEGLHAILMVALRQFEKEYDVLIHRAYMPDFWNATAG